MSSSGMLFRRFEFDMSAEEAKRRELSVCVKNASSSFMNRDKDVIGQVSPHRFTSAAQESFSYTVFLSHCLLKVCKHPNKINVHEIGLEKTLGKYIYFLFINKS